MLDNILGDDFEDIESIKSKHSEKYRAKYHNSRLVDTNILLLLNVIRRKSETLIFYQHNLTIQYFFKSYK